MSKLVYDGRIEIAEVSGQCVPVVDDAIKAGDLRTFLVGRRRKAFHEDVIAWLEFLRAESDAGRPVNYRARRDQPTP